MNGILYADNNVIGEYKVHSNIIYQNYVNVFNYYNTVFQELLTYYGYKNLLCPNLSSKVIICKLVDVNEFFHGSITISFSKYSNVENEIIFTVYMHHNIPYSFKYYFIDDKSFRESIFTIDSFVASNKLRQSVYTYNQFYSNNYTVNNECLLPNDKNNHSEHQNNNPKRKNKKNRKNQRNQRNNTSPNEHTEDTNILKLNAK